MIARLAEGLWLVESHRPGTSLALSFGVHGDERAPIEAGLLVVSELESGALSLERGRLALVLGNPRAAEGRTRWSAGGVDLNRCFQRPVIEREPALYEPASYEQERAREIARALAELCTEVLVDFHCTVEPGRRFLMHHPSVEDEAHRRVAELCAADVVLTDPELRFGGVSLDEWLSTAGRVGICYETGWMGDPANTPGGVLGEMRNLIVGLGLSAGEPRRWPEKLRLELFAALPCDGAGFSWRAGAGENLQALPQGTVLGAYSDGRKLVLEEDAVLVFPKKRPELVQPGKPLVYLARRH